LAGWDGGKLKDFKTRLYPNSANEFCQGATIALDNPLAPLLSLFSSLQVSHSSTNQCLSGWKHLWNRLLKEPEPPDITQVLDNCMRLVMLVLFYKIIEFQQHVQGGQNG
jgi:hypothetical protein